MGVEHTDKEWNDIYRQLFAAALVMLRAKVWYRGNNTDVFFMGKEAHDYVQETILSYMENPDNYDPTLGEFVEYLCYYIMRSLIKRDAERKENKTSDSISAFENGSDSDDELSYRRRSLLLTQHHFDEEVDYNIITTRIEELIEAEMDVTLNNIYTGRLCELKPREIRDEFSISDRDFRNGSRLLDKIFFRVAKEYSLESKSTRK